MNGGISLDIVVWEFALCRNDYRYADLTLIPKGPGSRKLKQQLALRCFACPVFAACEREAQQIPEHMRYGIWAGRIYG